MRNALTLVLCLLFIGNTIAQTKYNVACKDFTNGGFAFPFGKELKQIFESVISNSKYPFKIVERERLSKIFRANQEEVNLAKDLSVQLKKELSLAGIDYLVEGEMYSNPITQQYTLFINFYKITGKDVSEKLPLQVTLSKNEIDQADSIRNRFDKDVTTFVRNFFTNGTATDNIPQFYKEIDSLNKQINDIKKYTNIARLNRSGNEMEYRAPLVKPKTALNQLMDQIWEHKGSGVSAVRKTENSMAAIMQVTSKFPNFPFGYFCAAAVFLEKNDPRWVEYAYKSIEILKVTTSIEGHHTDHDAILEALENLLKSHGKDLK